MIEIKFFRWKKLYFSVEVTGHSGRRRPGLFGGFRKDQVLKEGGEFGNIICAAVSVLTFHLETGLMQVGKFKILRKEESIGYFYLELPKVPELKKPSRVGTVHIATEQVPHQGWAMNAVHVMVVEKN